jgi:hypothetical protein
MLRPCTFFVTNAHLCQTFYVRGIPSREFLAPPLVGMIQGRTSPTVKHMEIEVREAERGGRQGKVLPVR